MGKTVCGDALSLRTRSFDLKTASTSTDGVNMGTEVEVRSGLDGAQQQGIVLGWCRLECTLKAMCVIIDHPPTHSIVPSSTDTQAHGVPLSAVLRRHMHAITAMCSEHKCHSLPVRYVGLVVPVLPALQRVDVCIHTGLATGHRTRHGETRGSGATECVSLRCAGVEVCGGRRVTRAAVCVRVEGNRPAS